MTSEKMASKIVLTALTSLNAKTDTERGVV